MHNLNDTNTVRVKRGELLSTLRKNLEQHQLLYKETLEGRRDQVIKRLKDELSLLESPDYQIEEHIHFNKPVDMSKEYLQAIQRFEMETNEIIVLTENQFKQLVMDDWSWKDDLLRSATLYGKL